MHDKIIQLSHFHNSFCSPCSFLHLLVFLLLFFCNFLSSVASITSTLIIGTLYCLNYALLLLHLFMRHLAMDFIVLCNKHMSQAIIMTHINITKFLLINYLEKDHSMIETRRLKNVVIFIQTISNFVLSRKIIYLYIFMYIYIYILINIYIYIYIYT